LRDSEAPACAITGFVERRQSAVDTLGVLFRMDHKVIAEDHRFEWVTSAALAAVAGVQGVLPGSNACECHRNLASGKNGIVSTGC
jgi:hypothetical protein